MSSQLARVFRADKMNVAALGNMVPQLHFHHVVRYQNDSVWPKPVWGTPAVPYSNDVLAHMRQTLIRHCVVKVICHLTGVWTKSNVLHLE